MTELWQAFALIFSMMIVGGFIASSWVSFITVVLYRKQFDRKPNGRSQCACGRQLRWSENLPVVGWMRIRGVASCCGAQVPRYIVYTESLAFLGGALILLGVSLIVLLPSSIVLAVCCVMAGGIIFAGTCVHLKVKIPQIAKEMANTP